MNRNPIALLIASSLAATLLYSGQANAKGNPNDADITNYLEPNANIVTLIDAGWSTTATGPVFPRDHQYFIIGATGNVNLDTADDVEVDGSSIVEGQVTRGRNKSPGYINGLENYTGEAIVVTKGKIKDNPIQVREGRADLAYAVSPGGFSSCPYGLRDVASEFAYPAAIDDNFFEGVNGFLTIGQYTDGVPFEFLASGLNTEGVNACANPGYVVRFDGVRSIQDMYTGETIDLDSDTQEFYIPGFRILGLDEDGNDTVDLPDANQDGTLDGAGIEISCNAPFPRQAYVIMDPRGKAYSISEITGPNGFDVIPPNLISYSADCQDANTTVSPQIEVSDGVNTKYLTIDYNVTN